MPFQIVEAGTTSDLCLELVSSMEGSDEAEAKLRNIIYWDMRKERQQNQKTQTEVRVIQHWLVAAGDAPLLALLPS